MKSAKFLGLLGLSVLAVLSTYADQQINDNLAVQGLAVGFDASNNENYDFNTLIIKENNTRIQFLDTSNSGSFPSNDWVLKANDSNNGGRNLFSIQDQSAGRDLFTVEAGAPNNAMYIRSSGNVGIRTDAAAKDLHISSADSPTIRFDQNNSNGLPEQIWDMAGNESAILMRDVTNGTIPFQVKPGAPNNTIVMGPLGVGIGLESAAHKLHVRETGDLQTAVIENTNAASTARTVLELTNNGPATLVIKNGTDAATVTEFEITANGAGALVIGSPGNPLVTIDASGNLTAAGTVNGSSDRNRKKGFSGVNGADVLEKLSTVPVQTWSYKGEDTVHIGPMAQDFHKAFELGSSNRVISMADADGVALASIQALHKDSKAKEKEIARLREANRELEERLSKLEALLTKP